MATAYFGVLLTRATLFPLNKQMNKQKHRFIFCRILLLTSHFSSIFFLLPLLEVTNHLLFFFLSLFLFFLFFWFLGLQMWHMEVPRVRG